MVDQREDVSHIIATRKSDMKVLDGSRLVIGALNTMLLIHSVSSQSTRLSKTRRVSDFAYTAYSLFLNLCSWP